MTEQTINPTVAQVEEDVWVTLKNLQRFKTQYDAQMSEQLHANTAKIFKSQKTDQNTADTAIIEQYFKTNTAKYPRTGDIFVIETLIDGKIYERSSYCYETNKWEAITGNVDASKVILRENILMAGNYDRVGNFVKPLKGIAEIPTNGMSAKTLFDKIFTEVVQPKITAQPSVSGFVLNGAKAVEAGTKIQTATFGNAVLSAGSYEFGPATGITAQSYKIDRVAVPESYNKASVATASNGTDNNGGVGFIIGDGSEPNVLNSLKYTVIVNHNEGVVAETNTHSPSSPVVKIQAGYKQQTTGAYTAFRSFFYGATTDKPVLNSAYIRTLTNSNCAYSARTITINVPVGATRVCIACIAGKNGVTKVINETALNADVTGTFVKSSVNVEGANGYTAKQYNVWTFEPAVPYGQSAVLKVTLG